MNITANRVLPIRPKYATRIYDGTKTAELRPYRLPAGRWIFLYVTKPVQAITGAIAIANGYRIAGDENISAEELGAIGIRRPAFEAYRKGRPMWVNHIHAARQIVPVTWTEAPPQRLRSMPNLMLQRALEDIQAKGAIL